MASVTLSAITGALGSLSNFSRLGWESIGHQELCDNQYITIYEATVDWTGASSMNSFSISVKIASNTTSTVPVTVGCAISNTYPETSFSSLTSQQTTYNTSSSGTTASFTFSNLNITSGNIYIAFYRVGSPNNLKYCGGSGDTCSATFTASSITMSLSGSAVTTGNNQVATFGNVSGQSVSVVVKYNSTTLWSGSTSSGSVTIPVTKSWFTTAGITTYREISVSIRADASGGSYAVDNFKIVAGSDMNPIVGVPNVQMVQKSGKPTTYFPNTFLANISKAKVTVYVQSGSNASIAGVKLSYTGGTPIDMQYNSGTGNWEVTTPELVSQQTYFTATATDGRKYNISGTDVGGMSASESTTALTVVQYSPPSISIDSGATFRCTVNGTADSGGAYFLAKAIASYYSSLSGNSLLAFSVKIDAFSTVYNLTSGVQYGPAGGNMADTTNYTLIFTIEDKVSDAITKTFPLGSKVRDLVAKHNSTGTAFGVGTTPQKQAGSSVELPMGGEYYAGGFFWGSLTSLQYGTDGTSFGRDFRSVEVNTKYDSKNAEAAFDKPASDSLWSNIPSARSGSRWIGVRRVHWISGSMILVQILELYPTAGRIWWNYYDGSSWGGWRYSASYT